MRATAKTVAYELWRRYENCRSAGHLIPDLNTLVTEIKASYPTLPPALVQKGINEFLDSFMQQSVVRWITHRQMGDRLIGQLFGEKKPQRVSA